jgi:hypothetical protein
VEGAAAGGAICRRIAVAPGIELLIDEQHPVMRLNGDIEAITAALRRTLAELVGP